MKKIIIVNNNMKIGGVQKSLYNLLWSIKDEYDITLLLFSAAGEYMDILPTNIKIKTCRSLFRYLGISQSECNHNYIDYILRGSLAVICRSFGRKTVMPILLRSQPILEEDFDCAISFLHNGDLHHFYGGVNEFVLNKIKAKEKIAFLHCDYEHSGASCKYNNALYGNFDKIVACSEGCKKSFLNVMPELSKKCFVVHNFHRYDEINFLAQKSPYEYTPESVNIIMVGRLAHEKGIDRAIRAIKYVRNRGIKAILHLVGGGPKERELKALVSELDLNNSVTFHGNQGNPYRFMINADLLLITSYHEAAPMIIDEACALSLPILSVKTTSSHEMIEERNCGWVCENNQDSLNKGLNALLSNSSFLKDTKKYICENIPDNREAFDCFNAMIEKKYV